MKLMISLTVCTKSSKRQINEKSTIAIHISKEIVTAIHAMKYAVQ